MPPHPPYIDRVAHKAPCATTVPEGGLRLECGDPRAVGNGPTGSPGVLGRGGEAVGLRCDGVNVDQPRSPC